MSKKLPKKVYVRWNEDDPKEPFLMVSDDPKEISEGEATVPAGIYELTRKVDLVNETKVVE